MNRAIDNANAFTKQFEFTCTAQKYKFECFQMFAMNATGA